MTKYIVMMPKERYTKIKNFMTPSCVKGCGHISDVVKMINFNKHPSHRPKAD